MLTGALNHKNIKYNPERIPIIKPFIDQYNWREISFPSHSRVGKSLKTNNKTIALNILFVPDNSEEVIHAFISKYNSMRENQVTLSMVTDNEN